MEYNLQAFTIEQLCHLVEKGQIDLNPSYQRNFIWSTDNQKELIDTILKGYPLPTFFFYLKPDGYYEMVDGQQRTKTIYRFVKGDITSSHRFNKVTYNDINQISFLHYRIPVVVITSLKAVDSLKEFYVLINKKGVHLNVAEVNKSEYHDTNFLRLANELLFYQQLINLNLFSEATAKRMNDRAFVEELLGYLYSGIKDKKRSVENLFKDDIDLSEYQFLESQFKVVIDKIEILNSIRPIADTRYKQKNDFYTLFSFISSNIDEDISVLIHQYKVLLVLDGEDKDGRQLIRPSNENCEALRDYANNCITQSNSKAARENRLKFFNAILKNTTTSENEVLKEVLNYLSDIFEDPVSLIKVGNYELLNADVLIEGV
jgi:hypothetical protein